jgi:ubiquinone/menaquinone biosynthesis C-methylase UbiE
MNIKNPLKPRPGPQGSLATEAANIHHFDSEASGYDEQFGLSVDQGRARSAAIVLEGAATACTGFDISPEMVGVARRKTKAIDGCDFRVGSATTLPFESESFDLCVGDAFLHHILVIESCLKEVSRVLKPGGVAAFNEPNAQGYALFEFVLRSLTTAMGWRDPNLDNYLTFLAFVREHQGDLAALEANPLPDKHVFSSERIRAAAFDSGFSATSWVPAMDPSPTLWHDAFRFVLDAVKPSSGIRATVLQSADLLVVTLGEEARRHFCLHNQFYLYK